MAVPKKKTSVSRKGLRRAGQHHKLYAVATSKCPNCGAITRPHRVCSSCGHYDGKQVFTLKEKTESPEENLEA